MREWLINKRKTKNLTQCDVATKIGVNRSTIASYELGTRTPLPPIAQKLGKALGFKWTKFYS